MMSVGMVILMLVVIVVVFDWKCREDIIKKQKEELRMYQMYIQPMEELVKEIRAKQHEFDNHMHAILNMHRTIDNYEELVRAQSEYIQEEKEHGNSNLLPLLRISDKVLAGFLYSKIVNAKEYIQTDVQVRTWQILSRISEHDLVEVVGTLVDNAYEACTPEKNQVKIILDSENDNLVFEVKNQCDDIKLSDLGKFFEKGYSTKGDDGKRGLGLYHAKKIVEYFDGDITVGIETIEEQEYICFKVVV